jgi:hypothetical protein
MYYSNLTDYFYSLMLQHAEAGNCAEGLLRFIIQVWGEINSEIIQN